MVKQQQLSLWFCGSIIKLTVLSSTSLLQYVTMQVRRFLLISDSVYLLSIKNHDHFLVNYFPKGSLLLKKERKYCINNLVEDYKDSILWKINHFQLMIYKTIVIIIDTIPERVLTPVGKTPFYVGSINRVNSKSLLEKNPRELKLWSNNEFQKWSTNKILHIVHQSDVLLVCFNQSAHLRGNY